MPPSAKLMSQQVLEAAKARIVAIDPDTDSDYYDYFDFVEIVEPPPEQYLHEVPSPIRRMAMIWCDEEPVEPRDSGRNQATLAMIVTSFQRYEFDDRNPYSNKAANFKSRTEIRNEMKSDLIKAFSNIRLGGVSVFAEHVDSRNLQEVASTFNAERKWVEVELLFDVVYKYLRSQPWKTSAA